MQEKHLRLLEELDQYFRDIDHENEDWDILLITVTSMLASLNGALKTIEELEKDVAILKSKTKTKK